MNITATLANTVCPARKVYKNRVMRLHTISRFTCRSNCASFRLKFHDRGLSPSFVDMTRSILVSGVCSLVDLTQQRALIALIRVCPRMPSREADVLLTAASVPTFFHLFNVRDSIMRRVAGALSSMRHARWPSCCVLVRRKTIKRSKRCNDKNLRAGVKPRKPKFQRISQPSKRAGLSACVERYGLGT